MQEKVKKLLPIGSVVTVRGGNKRVMIFGILQTISDDPDVEKNREYDYVSVPYPEGNMGIEFQYFFAHEDIEQVHFRGFEDIERQEFIFNLGQYYKNMDKADT